MPLSPHHIPSIIGTRTSVKMFRVKTWRVIAAMKNKRFAHNIEISKSYHANPMYMVFLAIDELLSISSIMLRSSPFPTSIISFFFMFQKKVSQGFFVFKRKMVKLFFCYCRSVSLHSCPMHFAKSPRFMSAIASFDFALPFRYIYLIHSKAMNRIAFALKNARVYLSLIPS